MEARNRKCREKEAKSLLQELPYLNYRGDLASFHGQFNNVLHTELQTKRNLENLSSAKTRPSSYVFRQLTRARSPFIY